MQPVTMTLPFSAMASPIADSDSCLALSRKPQVLTMTMSAPSCLRASSYPSARSRVMIRSESTNALGHPSDVNEIRGALSMYSPGTCSELFGFAIQVIDRMEKFNRYGCSCDDKIGLAQSE